MPIGKQLEQRRLATGLTAPAFAKLAKLSGGASHLRKIERGTVPNPTLDTMTLIGVALAKAEHRSLKEEG